MAFDEYRDRGRIDLEDEFRGGDFDRSGFRESSETRWPGESSWGYGREYDEGFAREPRPHSYGGGFASGLEREGSTARGGAGFESRPRPVMRRRHGAGRFSRGIGWRPSSQYGQTSGFLYGGRPGELFDEGVYGSSGSYGSYGYGSTYGPYGYGTTYGVASHLANVPRGRFTGRGPKGYQRSDERIREDVSEELAQNGELDASGIEVRVLNCEVILEGEVDNREEKRLAEDIAEACPGVRDVENKIKVKKGFFARLFGTDDEEVEREERYSARESR